jgi:hypothetical protein
MSRLSFDVFCDDCEVYLALDVASKARADALRDRHNRSNDHCVDVIRFDYLATVSV